MDILRVSNRVRWLRAGNNIKGSGVWEGVLGQQLLSFLPGQGGVYNPASLTRLLFLALKLFFPSKDESLSWNLTQGQVFRIVMVTAMKLQESYTAESNSMIMLNKCVSLTGQEEIIYLLNLKAIPEEK